MLLDADDSQLVLVDLQHRLLPAIFEGDAVLANARRLGRLAKIFGVPVWGTEENPARLGENDADLRALCDRTLAKMHFDACEDGLLELLRPPPPRRADHAAAGGGNARSLPRHLRRPAAAAPAPAAAEPRRDAVLLAGCEAHVCLLQTALGLLEAEFEVWIVTDACGSRTERSRDAAYDRLAGAGCELVTTEMVAFEWLRTAAHPALHEVLALVK